MSKNPEYTAYLENQSRVYDKFRSTAQQLGHTVGIERDPGVDPQGAFLVAWRYPDRTTSLLEEFSLEAADVISALTYDGSNGHTTLSDFGLERGKEISPAENADHQTVLDTLNQAVKRGLELSGTNTVNGCGVEFADLLTNGKTIVAAGIPTESVWQINQEVLTQSSARGINLKGSWGAHMTTNSFLEAAPVESPVILELMNLIDRTPHFGNAKPVAIDVGYFQTDPQNGFVFTPYERFDLVSQ